MALFQCSLEIIAPARVRGECAVLAVIIETMSVGLSSGTRPGERP